MLASRAVVPDGWSAPGGPPYSPAVKAGGLVFVSGQLPIDPLTREVVPGTVQEQTRRAMENVGAVLAEAGTTFDELVQMRVYLLRRGDWDAMNEAYCDFVGAPPPARCVVVVPEMAPGVSVEIEAVAIAGELG